MIRRIVAAGLAYFLLTLPAGARSPQGQLQVFRGAATAVAVDVTVQTRQRRPISDLTAADFEVLDNGVRQEVTDLSYARLPIDLTIALDVSYSVNGLMLERLRRGITQLVADFKAGDRLRLLLFNSRIARTLDFTTDIDRVEAAIKSAVAGGGTALLDAISVALTSPVEADRRQLLVVFTDGIDSTSTTPPSVLTTIALRSRAAVTLVVPATAALGGRPTTATAPGASTAALGKDAILSSANTLAADNARFVSSLPLAAPRSLDQTFLSLASSTGGSVVPTTAASDLTSVFRQILAEFRSAYVLHYNVRGSDLAGYHTLDVKVAREGAVVIARRGYWY